MGRAARCTNLRRKSRKSRHGATCQVNRVSPDSLTSTWSPPKVAVEPHKETGGLAAHEPSTLARQQHDKVHCCVNIAHRRLTLAGAGEFEVLNFIPHLRVAEAEDADFLCGVPCVIPRYQHSHIDEAELVPVLPDAQDLLRLRGQDVRQLAEQSVVRPVCLARARRTAT